MNLIKYRPITRDLIDWDFDTLLDRFFSDSHLVYNSGHPKVDILEDDNQYLIKADLPGFTDKDIDVKVDGDLLTISSKEKEAEDNQGYIIRERGARNFSRSFTLPKDVDTDNIKALVKNGILTLELPKSPEVKPRSIEVTSN